MICLWSTGRSEKRNNHSHENNRRQRRGGYLSKACHCILIPNPCFKGRYHVILIVKQLHKNRGSSQAWNIIRINSSSISFIETSVLPVVVFISQINDWTPHKTISPFESPSTENKWRGRLQVSLGQPLFALGKTCPTSKIDHVWVSLCIVSLKVCKPTTSSRKVNVSKKRNQQHSSFVFPTFKGWAERGSGEG